MRAHRRQAIAVNRGGQRRTHVELGSGRQGRMPTLEDMIVDDLVHLRRERYRANKPAVAVLAATLNGRLTLLTGDGQAH